MKRKRLLDDMLERLRAALGERLISVALYGPGARGATVSAAGNLNLLIVASELTPATLEALGPAVRWWLGKNQPWPRLFTPALIRDSLDVYPVEFLDITHHHQILHGEDLLADIEVDTNDLRQQCERDLREKLMRLREGYVECAGARRPLTRLLAASFTSFAPVWRACLYLLGSDIPVHDSEVAARLCERLDLHDGALGEVGLLAAGAHTRDPGELYARYLAQLTDVVVRVDRFIERTEDSP